MKQSPKFRYIISLGLLISANPIVSHAFSHLNEQNVTNLGTAYSGTAALAEDASSGFYNAAALSRIREEQLVVGSIFAMPHNQVSSISATSSLGTEVFPKNSRAKPQNTTFIPAIHYAKRVNDQWVTSLNLVSTFGTKVNFKDDSVVRYASTRSGMKIINAGPSIAYDFENGVSLGFGLDAAYLDLRLASRVGGGTLATDGYQEKFLDNWGYGYHFAGLYQINDQTRLGAQYRSKVTIKAEGDAFSQLFSGAPIVQSKVKGTLTLPESIVLSAFHALDNEWAMMGDVQWLKFNRLDTLLLNFNNGTQSISNFQYKNTYRIAVGGRYQYNHTWQFKLGASFDKSPSRDATRTLYVPNQDSKMAALGTQFRVSKNLAFDFAYAYKFSNKANINQVAPTQLNAPQSREQLQTKIKNQMHVLGLQLTWDVH